MGASSSSCQTRVDQASPHSGPQAGFQPLSGARGRSSPLRRSSDPLPELLNAEDAGVEGMSTTTATAAALRTMQLDLPPLGGGAAVAATAAAAAERTPPSSPNATPPVAGTLEVMPSGEAVWRLPEAALALLPSSPRNDQASPSSPAAARLLVSPPFSAPCTVLHSSLSPDGSASSTVPPPASQHLSPGGDASCTAVGQPQQPAVTTATWQLVLEASPPLSKGPDSSSLTAGWTPGLQLVSLTGGSTSSSTSLSGGQHSGSKASGGTGSSRSEPRVSEQQRLAPAWQRAQQDRSQPLAARGASAGSSISGGLLHCRGSVSVGLSASPDSTAAFDVTLPTDQASATACWAASPWALRIGATSGSAGQPGTVAAGGLAITCSFTHAELMRGPLASSGSAASLAGEGRSSRPEQPPSGSLTPPASKPAAAASSDGTTDTVTLALSPAMVPPAAAAGLPRQLKAVLLSNSPRMLVIDGFFDPALCRGLMELARDKLVRSRVASGSETPSRTSWGTFFVKEAAQHALVAAAEARVAALFDSPDVLGPFPPLCKVEAMQVVRYFKGEFYHEHYDNRADGPLLRAATIIVYLNDVPAGGATSFSRAVTNIDGPQAAAAAASSGLRLPPKVEFGRGGRGVKVLPRQGRALVFWSTRPNGDEDPNSIHAADAVVEGEKWIASRWMQEDRS